MASARKPESFVWTGNEVELLLRLTLDYKASKLQETRTHACSPPSLLLLWDIAGVRGRRLELEEWGDGTIVSESMQIRCRHKNVRAAFFHPETRFQISVFSGTAFTGSLLTISQNDAKNVCLHKRAFPFGQALSPTESLPFWFTVEILLPVGTISLARTLTNSSYRCNTTDFIFNHYY